MSSITSGNADTAAEKKKMAEPADRNTMKHKHFSEEQVYDQRRMEPASRLGLFRTQPLH